VGGGAKLTLRFEANDDVDDLGAIEANDEADVLVAGGRSDEDDLGVLLRSSSGADALGVSGAGDLGAGDVAARDAEEEHPHVTRDAAAADSARDLVGRKEGPKGILAESSQVADAGQGGSGRRWRCRDRRARRSCAPKLGTLAETPREGSGDLPEAAGAASQPPSPEWSVQPEPETSAVGSAGGTEAKRSCSVQRGSVGAARTVCTVAPRPPPARKGTHRLCNRMSIKPRPQPRAELFMILLYFAAAKKSLEFRFARKFLIVLAIRLLRGCL